MIIKYTIHCDIDPAALEKNVCDKVKVANQWYHNNGMIVNEIKH